jgi:hypothetical protein
MRIGHNRPPRRQQPERVMTERQIHRAVAQHLTLRGADGLMWFHPVNEGRRSPREGFSNGRYLRPGRKPSSMLPIAWSTSMMKRSSGMHLKRPDHRRPVG